MSEIMEKFVEGLEYQKLDVKVWKLILRTEFPAGKPGTIF